MSEAPTPKRRSESGTNPFTLGERMAMLDLMLYREIAAMDPGTKRIYFVGSLAKSVEDDHNIRSMAFTYLVACTPRADLPELYLSGTSMGNKGTGTMDVPAHREHPRRGYGALVQRRLGAGQYEYIFQRGSAMTADQVRRFRLRNAG